MQEYTGPTPTASTLAAALNRLREAQRDYTLMLRAYKRRNQGARQANRVHRFQPGKAAPTGDPE